MWQYIFSALTQVKNTGLWKHESDIKAAAHVLAPPFCDLFFWNTIQPESYCVQVCQCWQVSAGSLRAPAPPPTLTSYLLGEFDALGVG